MTTVSLRDRIDLNGIWDLAFDEAEGPTRLDWVSGSWPGAISTTASVPSVWNAAAPEAPAIGYHRRVFEAPPEWSGRVINLHIEGACYRLDAWVNGAYVGSHEGAYTGFTFDVSTAFRLGETNELVFRVTSLSRTRAVDGLLLKEMPVAKQSWYYPERGIWGSVWLELLAPVYCRSLAIEPDPQRSAATIEIELANTSFDTVRCDLLLSIADPRGSCVFEHRECAVIQPGTSRLLFKTPIAHPLLWSLHSPDLYVADVRLERDGVPVDGISSTFGMREFTVRAGQFFLNGEAIFIRGVLMQPSYPAGLLAPLDPSMLETEVCLAREAGFNLMRVHLRPAVPGFLDLTDRLGMLVYAESSLAWIQESPRLLDHARREVTALIERDRNHPSVVFWGIFNEHRGPSARYSDALIRTARALDATRVVVDNSGGSLAVDQDFGWIDRATVVPDRSMARETIQDVHIYAGAPLSKRAFDWFASLGSPFQEINVDVLGIGSQPIFDEWQRENRDDPGQIFVTEIGCGGMGDLEAMVAGYGDQADLLDAREYAAFRDSLYAGFAERGLERVFGSVSELVRQAQHQQAMGNRRQIEALLTNPRVSGYAVTQLADVSCEFHAGVLDLWRKPKAVFHEIRRLQQPRVIILNASHRAATAGSSVEIAVTLVDQVHTAGDEELIVNVFDSGGAAIDEFRIKAPPGKGIKPAGTIEFPVNSPHGVWRIMGRLSGGDDAAVEESVLVLPDDLPGGQESLLDEPVVAALRPAELEDEAWRDFFDSVRLGKTGIVGNLTPNDRLAIDAFARAGVDVELHMGIGSWLGYYHWTEDSPIFDGLPSGGVSGEVYADVIPRYVLGELGGRVVAGSVSNTQTRFDEPKMLWYSDIEMVPFGSGRLIFCQYRVFEKSLSDPVGLRLRTNLLKLAAGRGETG